ncbi:MAG TPA: efflux RND transporter periplasmic adaptor subunit [Gemmatimonadota bacterium]|nr:efflux RND transporter periplasmic adaptor subunit [Gemmatimonadota bacterium]
MKRPAKKWMILGSAVVAVALIVVSLVTSRESGIGVEVETVERRALTAVVSASGTLQPKQSVSISATAPGEVVRVGVAEGQHVEEGDFLLQLDPVNLAAGASGQAAAVETARADLRAAEAQLAFARQDYERKRSLAGADLIPRAEIQAARAELRAREAAVSAARSRVGQSQASLTSARHDLGRITITSPIDGIVTRVNVEEGEVAMIGTMNQPGTVLLVIADLGVMEATIEVDETDVVDVEIGQTASVTVDAFPDTTFAGRVTEVGTSPKIVPTAAGPAENATDFEVVITLEDDLPAARSGLSCSADIVTSEREAVLTIPIQSLVVRQVADDTAGSGGGVVEREGVFVVEDGTARFVPVRVGISGERHFEVLSGVDEGDQVVRGSYQALRDLTDGARVEIEEPDEEGAEGAA